MPGGFGDRVSQGVSQIVCDHGADFGQERRERSLAAILPKTSNQRNAHEVVGRAQFALQKGNRLGVSWI